MKNKAPRPLLYGVYHNMLQRCCNPKVPNYERYGARGITVCDRWKKSFKHFVEDMGERPQGFTLDRINNNESYSKENCRWADSKQQSRNKSNNVFITYQGSLYILADFIKEYNLKTTTTVAKLKKGFTPNQIVKKI